MKEPLRVPVMMRRIEKAIQPFKPAALFELAEEGFKDPFEQLIACLISIRTRDETSLKAAERLLKAGRTAAQIARLREEEIDRLIRPATFHRAKAVQIQRIAQRVVREHGGKLPCDEQTLLSMPGIGPKCANLALGIACGIPKIGADIHVHRVTNRWGYVSTRTPEETMRLLEAKLPKKYWVTINRLLVPFGKHVCTGALPKCSQCPVLSMCRQVGVTKHR